jgi:2'-hydroxyisoflavone reductase
LIRLGLIVGPGDYTDRFTWWVRRADQGGELALPAPADRAVQFIDVRDAARFLLHLAETGQGGPFNVTGQPMGLADLIGQMVAVAGSGTQACTRPLSAFLDAGITPWTGLPLVLPDDPAIAGMLQVDTARARTAGLTTRPLQETISAVLDWDRTRRDVALVCGFDPVAAAKVLAANP